MACNLTRTNARICTQDRITLDTSISGNRSDWRVALQKRVWGHKAGSTGVSSEPWKPRGQNASWSASNTAWPAEGKSWLSHCTHCWCSLATKGCDGPFLCPKEVINNQWRGWKKCPVRSRGEFWACLVCRKGGSLHFSLQFSETGTSFLPGIQW